MTRSLCRASMVVMLGFVALAGVHAGDTTIGTLDSKGVKIADFPQGKGEPVVLIHAWLSSAGLNWALPGISGELAKKYKVKYEVPPKGGSGD